jgi:serine protease AprX
MSVTSVATREALSIAAHLDADERFAGRGVAIAIVDAAFYPHPDLVRPANRIRAWADASSPTIDVRLFERYDIPRWPERSGGERAAEWHGLMTSATAAGGGYLSDGRFRGLAYESDVVLVQAGDGHGVSGDAIVRALGWVRAAAAALNIRVISLSVAGDDETQYEIDDEVEALTADGVVVVAAAGNDGIRRLLPPATSFDAITVGGVDDHNSPRVEAANVWHSNFGEATGHAQKPEVIAPSMWTVAPLLPGTEVAEEARRLAAAGAFRGRRVERVEELQLVSPHYHFVEGTSVAAPIVAGVVACMIEANGSLTPERIKRLLMDTAVCVQGDGERQGAGAVQAGAAVAAALRG